MTARLGLATILGNKGIRTTRLENQREQEHMAAATHYPTRKDQGV